MVGLLEITRSSQPEKDENKNKITENNFHNKKILEGLKHQQIIMKKTDDVGNDNGKLNHDDVVGDDNGKLNHDDDDDSKNLHISTTATETTTTTIDNTDEAILIENVKLLLDEVLNLVENSLNKNGEQMDVEHSGVVENEEEDNRHKGILKHERTYSNKHVDFDLALQYIPFDPKKDYTIDIQFVETIKKRVVSYAALYAQKKAEEEEEEEAAAAAAGQADTAEDAKLSVETAAEQKNKIETNSIIVEVKSE